MKVSILVTLNTYAKLLLALVYSLAILFFWYNIRKWTSCCGLLFPCCGLLDPSGLVQQSLQIGSYRLECGPQTYWFAEDLEFWGN